MYARQLKPLLLLYLREFLLGKGTQVIDIASFDSHSRQINASLNILVEGRLVLAALSQVISLGLLIKGL